MMESSQFIGVVQRFIAADMPRTHLMLYPPSLGKRKLDCDEKARVIEEWIYSFYKSLHEHNLVEYWKCTEVERKYGRLVSRIDNCFQAASLVHRRVQDLMSVLVGVLHSDMLVLQLFRP